MIEHAPPADTAPAETPPADPSPAVRDSARLAAVQATGLLDSAPEPAFDRLTRLAARLVGAPSAFFSVVDETRDFYKSACGFGEPLASARELAGPTFCHYTIQSRVPLVIPDTAADPRYRDVPTVRTLGVAAYVGVPITVDDQVIGGLCVTDAVPRAWTAEDVEVLTEFAASIEREIALRLAVADAARVTEQLEQQAVELALQQMELEQQVEEAHAIAAMADSLAREVTVARDAAEAERASLARIVTQLPVAVAVYEGPDLVYRAVSGQYSAIIGGRDVVGRTIREALPELAGDEDYFALLDRVYATGEPFVGTDLPARWDDNGDGVIEDHLVDLVYAPIRDAPSPDGPGPVVGVAAFVADVTARARAQAAVRESEARFRNMADAAPVMLWVTDPTGRCTFLNARWLEFTGQTMETALGLGWLDAVHPDDAAEAGRVFLSANARHQPFRLDYRLRRHDGEYRWSVDAAAPRFGANGEYLGYVGSVVDIDERAQLLAAERAARADAEAARAEAEAANRAKSEFLAVMSHELRTPLNAIGGYAELIALGVRGPVTPEQRTDLDRLQRSQRHLLGLINEVLSFARVEAGAVQYEASEVDLDEVLATCEALTAPQIHAKGQTLRHAAWDPTLRVRADRKKVQQIVLNLLSNAVKFTSTGGQIALSCAAVDAPSRMVHITVSDTGRGIAPEQLARVFEPFVQVDARLTRTQEGTGLGLAISRDLARGMGGDLTVESRLAVGSTFTLALPAL